jgi:hypothetical protein
MLEISKIKYDGTQSRVEINQDIVQEYADALTAGAKFPSVVVFFDGVDYWLADGFHRFLAHVRAGNQKIQEEVIPGTKREAILYSTGANFSHGLRRSNADKRKSVLMLLEDSEWTLWSNEQIAKQCHVSAPLVSDIRKSISNPTIDGTPRTVTRNGTTYQQNTSNIGKKPAPDTGRSVSDIFKALDTHSVPQNTAQDDAPEEFRMIPMTHTEQLEQRVKELADCLEDTSKALADLGNDGSENYVSEITKLRRELDAVTVSRDSLMFENSELKKHIKYLEKKLKA